MKIDVLANYKMFENFFILKLFGKNFYQYV